MNEESRRDLLQLVELLRDAPQIEWDQIESLLVGFPGWFQSVDYLRGQVTRQQASLPGWHTANTNWMNYYEVLPPMREKLLALFTPYALLLNPQLTQGERAQQLEEATEGRAREFCEECLQNALPMIVEAAREVLAACVAEESLLRGTTAPETPPSELLHLPQETSAANPASLLHPAETPRAASPSKPQGWFARLFHRQKPS